MLLSNQQKRFLRKLGHNLKPVILIGSSGIKESLLQEIDTTIEKHELIKIKVKTSDRNQRNKIDIFDDYVKEKSRNLGIRISTRNYEQTYNEEETRGLLEMLAEKIENKFKISLNMSKS